MYMSLLVEAKAGNPAAVSELIVEMVPVIANLALGVQRSWDYYYELDDVIWIIAAYIPGMLDDLDVEQAGDKWKSILAAWCRNRLFNLLQSLKSKRKSVVSRKVNIHTGSEESEVGSVSELPSVGPRPRREYTKLRNLYFEFIRSEDLPQKHVEIFMATYPIQGVEDTTCSEVADRWGISKQRASFIAAQLTDKWKEFYLEAQCKSVV